MDNAIEAMEKLNTILPSIELIGGALDELISPAYEAIRKVGEPLDKFFYVMNLLQVMRNMKPTLERLFKDDPEKLKGLFM